MGKQTKSFRNTKSSSSANYSARAYGKFNREGSWYGKIVNLVPVRGRGGPK